MIFFFFLGWGMGFMKVGLGLCEFGILDNEGFVWVWVYVNPILDVCSIAMDYIRGGNTCSYVGSCCINS